MNTETSATKTPWHKKYRTFIVIAIIIAVLGFGGNWYITQSTEREPLQTASIVDSLRADATLNEDGPVARVNGDEVSRLSYQNRLKEITDALARQKFNTANAKIASQIRQQAIAELVNFTLLYQAGVAAGLSASDAEVAEAYQLLIEDMGDEETLILALGDRDLTPADAKEDLRQQLIVDSYITANVDLESVAVTPDEVSAYYQNISANNEELPSFESVEAELTAQLLDQQRQQLVTDLIQTLRATAEIEVLI